MSWNIDQLCKYVKVKRGNKSLWRCFFQCFVESDLLLLLFVQWPGWCWGLDWCSYSWCHWLLCLIGGLIAYCQYRFSDRMPTGWEVACCTTKASFSSFESLREATVTASSSIVRETLLHDLPLSLGLLDSYRSSLMISRWTHMISPNFIVIEMWPLAFYFSAIGLMASNLILETGHDPSWTVIYGKVPKLGVTILAVTFFYSNLRVRTPASTNAWILSLRTKYLLVG